ncbi:MAG: beta-ketoacyl synthase N-terminal-like domain-containing protein [Verrucomicrobiales bacterium]
MSAVYLRGVGAVSPAGWGVDSLYQAILHGHSLQTKELNRPSGRKPHQARLCPPPPFRPSWIAHPRLRRSSPISQYALGAACEALEMGGIPLDGSCAEMGIVVAVFTGCVQYSRRFYQEVLNDPSTASPLIFPETVFNAPASHLGAFLKCAAANYTLVGDTGTFLAAAAVAANWIQMGKVKHCIVLGAEEADWLTAEGVTLFKRHSILAEGSGAILLSNAPHPAAAAPIRLISVSNEFLYAGRTPENALQSSLQELGPSSGPETIVIHSGEGAHPLLPATPPKPAEKPVGWSPQQLLGEGLMAGSSWQAVLAGAALMRRDAREAIVSIAGLHQHAIAAKFALEEG